MITDQPLLKELESTLTVRFQDCDPFGHLNNARYVDYFMNARQDQLAEFYDFRIFDVGRQLNMSWLVTRSHLAYLAPAGLMEEVRIRTRLIHLTDNSLVVEGVMLDQAGRRVKAVAWIEFTFVSLATGRAATHPEELMDFFSPVVVDVNYAPDHFEQRVQELKTHYRHAARPQTALAVAAPASP
ncbi:MAG: acyl-CoA thioesterase [Chloroflexi bacterium]|nr:acyl-CoA thioesterase [Chloroflexota bacterium]MCI0579059.1 acyl-CoA thioesterase [Chloroflexota bacterium]MCI0644464.1 acyl-CoA thioesterase [Chloroflexota bacterium]MCI0725852.1 acyl-CoA thioesterase [Chloroflexota bacterium]